MSKERQHIKDIKLLSVYLDHELSLAQQQALEKRLNNEPDLRRKLHELRKTKMVLGSLARVHAPRNFTLTPDMVTVRRKKQVAWFSTLKLATSLAAILLVVLFSFELIIQRGFLGGTRTTMETGAQTESLKSLDEETPEPLIFWSDPSQGVGGGTTEELEEDTNVMAEPPQVDGDRSPEESDIKEEPIGEEVPEESLETNALAPSPEEETNNIEGDVYAAEDQDLILGLNPESGGEIIDQTIPSDASSRLSKTVLDVFDWLQIALGLFILFGGVTLWILRSKQIF
jgi:hypothetical protein